MNAIVDAAVAIYPVKCRNSPISAGETGLALVLKVNVMNTSTASVRTSGFLTLFDYHTGFFRKVLEGLSQEDMHNRLHTAANHPAWIAGALVHQRLVMANGAGANLTQTGEALFKDWKGIQEGVGYPSNEEYLSDWEKITPLARQALTALDDAKLDSMVDMGGTKMSFYELTGFTIYREASMIGQLALWRRLLGHPAMRYDE